MTSSTKIIPRRLNEIAIELTSKCNLHCRMCSVWKGRKDGLPRAEIEMLLRQARQLGAQVFVPFGAEIFMRKDSMEILETAGRLGYRDIPVVTNGMIIARHAERLSHIEGLTLGISIDGPEATHDTLRGRGSFAAALEGLRAARACGIPVALKGVLMRPTLQDAGLLVELAVEHGITQVTYQPFQPEIAGLAEDHSEWLFRPGDRRAVEHKLSELVDLARLRGVRLFTEGFFSQIIPYLFDRMRPIPPGGCHLPSRFLMVTGTGETHPCFFMRGQSLGNVSEGATLRDIWNGPLQLKMQARGLTGACPGCLASCSDLPSYDAAGRAAAQT